MNRQYELGILTRKDEIVALDHQKYLEKKVEREVKSLNICMKMRDGG